MERKDHLIYLAVNDFTFYCGISGDFKVTTISKGSIFSAFDILIERLSRKDNNDVYFIDSLECTILRDSTLCKCIFHTKDNTTLDYYLKVL